MTEAPVRTVETQRDYVDADKDPDSFFIKIVDAITGEDIPDAITEANAVDGWYYRASGKAERYFDDRGLVAKRPIIERVEREIAIIFKPEAPASLRGQGWKFPAQ